MIRLLLGVIWMGRIVEDLSKKLKWSVMEAHWVGQVGLTHQKGFAATPSVFPFFFPGQATCFLISESRGLFHQGQLVFLFDFLIFEGQWSEKA